jgi:hypothetical protein
MDDHIGCSRSEVEILVFDNLEDIKENWRADTKVAWLCLSDFKREIWKMKEQEKSTRQPVISDQIVASLQKNPSKSLEKVAQPRYWEVVLACCNWTVVAIERRL